MTDSRSNEETPQAGTTGGVQVVGESAAPDVDAGEDSAAAAAEALEGDGDEDK